MNLSKIIAALIWVLLSIDWVKQLTSALTSPPRATAIVKMPPAGLLLPVVVVAFGFLTARRDPFDIVSLRLRIDYWFGDGSYAGFIRALKPQLLFAVAAILSSMICSTTNFRSGAPHDAYWLCGFPFCFGVSLLVFRQVLARRGLSMEVRSTSSCSPGPTLVPRWLQRVRATNITAFLAGVWFTFGKAAAGSLAIDTTRGNVSILWAIICFFIPGFLFVVGTQGRPYAAAEWGRLLVRFLFWFLGMHISSIVYGFVKDTILPAL